MRPRRWVCSARSTTIISVTIIITITVVSYSCAIQKVSGAACGSGPVEVFQRWVLFQFCSGRVHSERWPCALWSSMLFRFRSRFRVRSLGPIHSTQLTVTVPRSRLGAPSSRSSFCLACGFCRTFLPDSGKVFTWYSMGQEGLGIDCIRQLSTTPTGPHALLQV